MSVTIRTATVEDLSVILRIVNDAILNTTAIYDYDQRSYEQQLQWFNDKQSSNQPVVVAEISGAVIGFGTYGTFRIKIGYRHTVEHSVYVDETYTGRGAGKLILNRLVMLAGQQGYHTMIGCIDASNASSIAFHEKFGFVNKGTLHEAGYKFGRWLDLVFMQRMLP